jgi:hypothetical protein
MKNQNSGFAKLAQRLWPVTHRRFEEMCALAVTGQLGGPQMCELDQHIAVCDSCRKYLESTAQVSLQTMPLLAEKRAPAGSVATPAGMRERFLARLASEDFEPNGNARPRTAAIAREHLISLPLHDPHVRKIHNVEKSKSRRWPLVFAYSSAAVAACLVVGLAGFYIGERHVRAPASTAQSIPSTSPASQESVPVIAPPRVNQLEEQKTQLESQLAELKGKLASADAERASLRDEVAAAREKLAAFADPSRGLAQHSSEQDQQANNQMASLQSDVDRLDQRLAQSEINASLQKQKSDELAAKLDATEADLQQERDLRSAKTEMGDLVAARSLHIVDVYDADTNGKRQRSFGRVFYVEGKSLVFYAYDLDDPRQFKGNVVFHVWGGQAGGKVVTHSLGILHKDDEGQNRWAMTFDDPNVLAHINSVFVTAESASKQYDAPHGKKILYAYFGSPANHP